MVGSTTRRRRAAILSTAATLALALSLAACGKGAGNPSPADSGNAALGNAPSSSASPSGGTTSGGTGTGGGGGGTGASTGNSGPTYPKDAKSYGLEILKALGNKDYTRMGELADANTVSYAKQYANKNASWTNTDCGTSGPTSTCNYYNQTGDIATVGMITATLGKERAGNSVSVEGGTYDKAAQPYVQAFGQNMEFGTYAHMVSLSSNSIADHFKSIPKFSSVSAGVTAGAAHPCTTNASKTCVDLMQVGGTATLPTQHLIVDMSRISAGKPNGIIGYEPAT